MKSSIAINGNDNHTAGRDYTDNSVNINYNIPPVIRFSEQDIKDVINYFADELDDVGTTLDDTHCVDIEEKNKINKLSSNYFDYMKKEHSCYFYKIRTFLLNPKNKECVDKYERTVGELQCKIMINHKKFPAFEEMFGLLLDYVISKNEDDIRFIRNRNLLIIFLHFMYWNCDIGYKYDNIE